MTRAQFEDKILPLSRNMYRFAFRFLSNREEAEDTVQEIFIKLWNMRKKLHKYRSVEALAMTICRNMCLDILRKRGRKTFDETIPAETKSSDNDPLHKLENSEACGMVMEIVDTLPENYQTVLKMRDVEGYDYDDIAEVMGLGINLLRVNLSRARKIVRERINEMYHEPARTEKPA